MNKKIKIISLCLIIILLIGIVFRYSRTNKISMGKGLFLFTSLLVILGMIMYFYNKDTL